MLELWVNQAIHLSMGQAVLLLVLSLAALVGVVFVMQEERHV